MSSLVSQT